MKYRQGFVSPQLDHGAVPSLDVLASDISEPRRQPGSRFIAPLVGERGVSADIRDQEGIDLTGRFFRHVGFGVAATLSAGCMERLADLPHTAHFRPSASGPPDPGAFWWVAHGVPASSDTLENDLRGFQPFSSPIRQAHFAVLKSVAGESSLVAEGESADWFGDDTLVVVP